MVESIGEESMPWSCCDYLITQEYRNATNNNHGDINTSKHTINDLNNDQKRLL